MVRIQRRIARLEQQVSALDPQVMLHHQQAAATGHLELYEQADRLATEADGGQRALQLWSKHTICCLLQNRFYIGEVRYQDQWHKGQHDAIVDAALFARCQEVRTDKRREFGISADNGSRIYPLTGLVRCAGCGHRLRASPV